MAVNSFSSGLEKTLIDKQGHLRLQTQTPVSSGKLQQDLLPYQDFLVHQALLLSFEALILKDGQFKGVFFEAIQDDKLRQSSFLKNRIVKGDLKSAKPFIIVGLSLAEELDLSPGDKATVIVPQPEEGRFSRRPAHFKVGALVDFGQYSFNSSLAIMPLSFTKIFGQDYVSGAGLWLKKKAQVSFLKQKMEDEMEDIYSISSWKDMDRAFFEVIESDKKIIFLVLLILIISSGFNISSSLFIQVFKKTKEISILKAMGAKKGLVRNLFLLQGLFLALVGSVIGVLIGLLLCRFLIFAQNQWHFIPVSVYKVNELAWATDPSDLLLIFVASWIIVILSSLLPAKRAYQMNVQAGLAND